MPPARSFTLESGSVLVVKRARPEDADEYFCLAENAAGEARASAEVAVNCKFLGFGQLNNPYQKCTNYFYQDQVSVFMICKLVVIVYRMS